MDCIAALDMTKSGDCLLGLNFCAAATRIFQHQLMKDISDKNGDGIYGRWKFDNNRIYRRNKTNFHMGPSQQVAQKTWRQYHVQQNNIDKRRYYQPKSINDLQTPNCKQIKKTTTIGCVLTKGWPPKHPRPFAFGEAPNAIKLLLCVLSGHSNNKTCFSIS